MTVENHVDTGVRILTAARSDHGVDAAVARARENRARGAGSGGGRCCELGEPFVVLDRRARDVVEDEHRHRVVGEEDGIVHPRGVQRIRARVVGAVPVRIEVNGDERGVEVVAAERAQSDERVRLGTVTDVRQLERRDPAQIPGSHGDGRRVDPRHLDLETLGYGRLDRVARLRQGGGTHVVGSGGEVLDHGSGGRAGGARRLDRTEQSKAYDARSQDAFRHPPLDSAGHERVVLSEIRSFGGLQVAVIFLAVLAGAKGTLAGGDRGPHRSLLAMHSMHVGVVAPRYRRPKEMVSTRSRVGSKPPFEFGMGSRIGFARVANEPDRGRSRPGRG